MQADLSGAQRTVGEAQERGARLAVEQFNSRKDKPFALTLKAADDGGSAGLAQTAARKLIQDTDVLAVLGPTNDETATAALGTYDEALLPLLCVSAGGLILTSQQYRSFVYFRPSDAAVFPPSNGPTTTHVVPADSEDFDPVAAAVLAAESEAVVYGGVSPHRVAPFGPRVGTGPIQGHAHGSGTGPADRVPHGGGPGGRGLGDQRDLRRPGRAARCGAPCGGVQEALRGTRRRAGRHGARAPRVHLQGARQDHRVRRGDRRVPLGPPGGRRECDDRT
ncbi:ABC transporter substrate-binding protein [Streptomyces mirabilis]